MAKCKICRSEFQKRSMTHKCCGPECAEQWAAKERMRKANKDRREQREKLKRRSDWLKEAQAAFNSFIRERDKDLPCISCGRFHTGSYDAGHYRSVGAAPQLRFNEQNVHRQCVPCNQHKSGNVVEYRIRLVHKIGAEEVERLENNNEAHKWTIEEAKRIKAEYRQKLKALRSAMDVSPMQESSEFPTASWPATRETVAKVRF